MRPLKQILIALTIIAGMIGVSSAENPKIATVDMQKLFKEYYRTTLAQERFNLEYANIQKKVNERVEAMNRMGRTLKTLQSQIESGELSDEDKNKSEQEYKIISQEQKMVADDMQRFQEEEKSKVARLKSASMRGIMRELRQKVIDFSDQQGYDFVFDKSGKNTNQVSFFIYMRDTKDITASMLKELNKFAPDAKAK